MRSEQKKENQYLPFDLFSVRTQNVFGRYKIKTINDLLNLSETKLLRLSNFGRSCLEEVSQFMAEYDLKFGNDVSTIRELDSTSYRIVDHDLPLPMFSVRTQNVLAREKIFRFSELASYGLLELSRQPNMGPHSINQLRKHIESLGISEDDGWRNKVISEEEANRGTKYELIYFKNEFLVNPLSGDFKTYWANITKILSENEKEIIESRLGLFGDGPQTLEEIGQERGVTRERIRQIQKKASNKLRNITQNEICQVLEDLFNGASAPITIEDFKEKNEFFADFEIYENSCEYFFENFFSFRLHKISFSNTNQKYFLSCKTEEQLKLTKDKGFETIKENVGEKKEAVSQKLTFLRNEAGEFYENIISELFDQCIFAKINGSNTLMAIESRNTRYFEIAKIIQSASKPLGHQEILHQTKLTDNQVRGGLGQLSERSKTYGIYPYRHGLWCHISYIDADADSIKAILKACEMLDDSDTGDFHSTQANKNNELASKYDEFQIHFMGHHGQCLSQEICLRVTARHRKAFVDNDTIINVLSVENRVMHFSEIIEIVSKTRNIAPQYQIQEKAPLINLGDNYWALDYEDFGVSE